jgi:endonuclease-3
MEMVAVEMKNKDSFSTATFILKINQALLKKFGKPRRNYSSDPLDILIATILSQNTNDLNSHKAFLNLKKTFKNYEAILSADLRKLESTIKIAGLGNQKAKAIKNFLKTLQKEKGELNLKFLKDFEIEESLKFLTPHPGIGIKTAACVLLFGLHKNVCPVDTHVHRILNRLGIVKTSNRDKTFYFLLKNLPDGIAHEFHTNLIKLGRTICKSQNPECFNCPLIDLCKYENKNLKSDKEKKKSKSNNQDFMLLDSV